MSLFFNTSEAGSGEITAQAVGEVTGHLPAQIKPTSTSTYEVSFIPMKGEVYTSRNDTGYSSVGNEQ